VFDEPFRALAGWTESGGDLRSQLEANAAECARLAETLRSRTTELEAECAARLEVIERLEGLRADAVARLAERDAELAAETARSAGLELEVQTRQREIERLAAEVERLVAALGVASNRAGELERGVRALDGEILAMRSSWSWRLTAPLRFLARGRLPGGRSGEPHS
jgi:chromosome segregation ATPase